MADIDFPEPARKENYPEFFDSVEKLIDQVNTSENVNIEFPSITVLADDQLKKMLPEDYNPRDFTMSVNWGNSDLWVGETALNRFDTQQIEAILAHEIGHIFDKEGSSTKEKELSADIFSTKLVSTKQAIDTLKAANLPHVEGYPSTHERIQNLENVGNSQQTITQPSLTPTP